MNPTDDKAMRERLDRLKRQLAESHDVNERLRELVRKLCRRVDELRNAQSSWSRSHR